MRMRISRWMDLGTGHCMVYTMYCVLKHVLENNDIVNSAFDFV